MNVSEIVRQATSELEQEAFRTAVEVEKTRLRELRSRPWWQRLFPFKLKLERID